jgi:hypothetical protein
MLSRMAMAKMKVCTPSPSRPLSPLLTPPLLTPYSPSPLAPHPLPPSLPLSSHPTLLSLFFPTHQKVGVLLLQARARGRAGRKLAGGMSAESEAATCIQRYARGMMGKSYVLEMRIGAMKLQGLIRRRLATALVTAMRLEVAGATKLQSMMRGLEARVLATQMREERERLVAQMAQFSVSELRAQGFEAFQVKRVGFTAAEMRDAGFTAAQVLHRPLHSPTHLPHLLSYSPPLPPTTPSHHSLPGIARWVRTRGDAAGGIWRVRDAVCGVLCGDDAGGGIHSKTAVGGREAGGNLAAETQGRRQS